MKTHKFDTLSFVAGLAFTGFGLLFLIPNNTDALVDVFVDAGGWAWPLVLLGIGLAIVVPVFFRTDDGEEIQPEAAEVD